MRIISTTYNRIKPLLFTWSLSGRPVQVLSEQQAACHWLTVCLCVCDADETPADFSKKSLFKDAVTGVTLKNRFSFSIASRET